MKKTLVALAAVSAVSAFAQVTIDGYMDRGYRALSNSDSTKNLKTVGSNAGTTTFGIKYYEDIGGGMTVGGQVNTDWADIGGNTQGSMYAGAQASGFANSQSFVKFSSATAGTLQMGTPNNYTLTNATAIASPEFSTGVGSTYSDQFSIANGLGTGISGVAGTVYQQAGITNIANAGARAIRIANTYQYVSPSFNGVTFAYGTTLQNNNVTANSGNGNTVGVTEYMLRYSNGPIDAAYTSIKYDVGSNGTAQAKFTMTSGTPVAGSNTLTVQDNTQNLLGVKYTTPVAGLVLNVGFGNFTSSSGTYSGSSKTYGGTYTNGALDYLAIFAKVDDTSTTNIDRTMTGLGVNYNLSKTSRVYYRYDSINYGSNVTAASGSTQKRTAIGVSKSF
jgi:predicted porin